MKRWLILAAVLYGGAAAAEPAGDAESGAAKAAVCGACHGPGGNSTNPEWPKLAGQSAHYLYAQLQNFQSGLRPSTLMPAQVANLGDQDFADLAAYYAAQRPTPGVASEDALEVAAPLYRHGDAARGLPACSACHGPAGEGIAAAGYPRLGGQHATYTAAALREMASFADQPLPEGLPIRTMAPIAAMLTDAEIDALASYVGGLH